MISLRITLFPAAPDLYWSVDEFLAHHFSIRQVAEKTAPLGARPTLRCLRMSRGRYASAKLPMATATYPGKPSCSQYTVAPHVGQK
jgi:hypothetical protein